MFTSALFSSGIMEQKRRNIMSDSARANESDALADLDAICQDVDV
jgi:hypothetical protein